MKEQEKNSSEPPYNDEQQMELEALEAIFMVKHFTLHCVQIQLNNIRKIIDLRVELYILK